MWEKITTPNQIYDKQTQQWCSKALKLVNIQKQNMRLRNWAPSCKLMGQDSSSYKNTLNDGHKKIWNSTNPPQNSITRSTPPATSAHATKQWTE